MRFAQGQYLSGASLLCATSNVQTFDQQVTLVSLRDDLLVAEQAVQLPLQFEGGPSGAGSTGGITEHIAFLAMQQCMSLRDLVGGRA
ncbi:hypothetical protein PO002_24065 [Cupriavidus necator]|uniref:hypothetical protein n=1 Tax=Cupriavidus necator TaxID=106590 RepID=UPI0039C40D4D